MATNSSYSRTYIDYSKEKATARINTVQLTAANYAAQAALLATLATTMDALSLGEPCKRTTIIEAINLGETPPADDDAQRERKWLVRYEHAATHQVYKMEIPCADVSLLQVNSDMADLTKQAWLDFIAAFEAVATAPDGNVVVFLDAQKVGRNT